MAFPAVGMESTYRNNLEDVSSMLKEKHPGSFYVYNLSERTYDYDQFEGMVQRWCYFPDHTPPPLSLLFEICLSMLDWLLRNETNICVVHCLVKLLFFVSSFL